MGIEQQTITPPEAEPVGSVSDIRQKAGDIAMALSFPKVPAEDYHTLPATAIDNHPTLSATDHDSFIDGLHSNAYDSVAA